MHPLRRWRVALLVALMCARATSARASFAYDSVHADGVASTATKFDGDGVTVWDGRVIFAPNASAAVGVFEPATNAFTLVPIGAVVEFEGGALANDGRVVFAPAADHSLVGVFDPETDTFESVVSETTTAETIAFGASRPFVGAARLGDGRIAFVPYQATFVMVFDPATGTSATHDLPAPLGDATIGKFAGAAATPDGCVVFAPSAADAAGRFCVDGASASGFALELVALASDSPLLGLPDKFSGAVATERGDVIFAPLLADATVTYERERVSGFARLASRCGRRTCRSPTRRRTSSPAAPRCPTDAWFSFRATPRRRPSSTRRTGR